MDEARRNTVRLLIDTLDRLYAALDKIRAGSKSVTVKADDLRALLRDHSAFADAIKTTT